MSQHQHKSPGELLRDSLVNKTPQETISPIIFYRNTFVGGDGWTYYPLRVTVSAFCPICGARRGELKGYNFCEDGEWYHVDRWENKCGHIDQYEAVWKEAQARKGQTP